MGELSRRQKGRTVLDLQSKEKLLEMDTSVTLQQGKEYEQNILTSEVPSSLLVYLPELQAQSQTCGPRSVSGHIADSATTGDSWQCLHFVEQRLRQQGSSHRGGNGQDWKGNQVWVYEQVQLRQRRRHMGRNAYMNTYTYSRLLTNRAVEDGQDDVKHRHALILGQIETQNPKDISHPFAGNFLCCKQEK